MSSLKKSLMKQGMKLMSDPRVLKLMQDERVMKAVMQMMAVPGMVQSFTQEQVERLVKSMALATEDEVKDQKRTVRGLDEELARMKHAQQALNAETAGKKAPPPEDRFRALAPGHREEEEPHRRSASASGPHVRLRRPHPVAPEPRFRLASDPRGVGETKRRHPWPTRSSGCQSSSQGSGRHCAKTRGGSVPR